MRLLEAARLKPLPTGLRHGTVSTVQRRAAGSRSPPCAATWPPTAGTPRSSSPTISRRTRRGATSPINAMSCDARRHPARPDGRACRPRRRAGALRRRPAAADRRGLSAHPALLPLPRPASGRGEPDPAALAACAELAAGIDGLSGERVRQELWLILGGAEPLRAAGADGRCRGAGAGRAGAAGVARARRTRGAGGAGRPAAAPGGSAAARRGRAGRGGGRSAAARQPRARASAGAGDHATADGRRAGPAARAPSAGGRSLP